MAVALMVIEVDTSPSGMPPKSSSMSSRESMATPTRTHLAGRQRVIGVVPDLRRQVESHAQAGDTLGQQVAVARVRL